MKEWIRKAAIVAFGALAGIAYADIPDNLTDLVYQDAGSGSGQLRSRGYTQISSSRSGGKNTQYWWNGNANTCVRAVADGGKYEALVTTSPTDCNQYHSDATKNNNAAAAAIAAAAILGVAALAHNSHQRDNKYNDPASMAEFDRGYRDGLHHERYHNRNDSSGYSDGYNAGQRERDEQTSHRSDDGRYSGYHPYVNLNDLVGARAAGADSDLRNRGFRDTGGFKQGDRSYVTWYNQNTHQCVNAITRDGRIDRFEDINEGNCQ
jgi:hypothetical protein